MSFSAKSDGAITFVKKISSYGTTVGGAARNMMLIPQDKIDGTLKKNLGKQVTVKITSL